MKNYWLLLATPLRFSSCTSTVLKIPKLTLIYYLKSGTMVEFFLPLFIFFIHIGVGAGSL